YCDDLVDGFVRFMNSEGSIGPMNLGNPGEFTIRQLAEKVIELTNSSSKIVFRPLPEDDPLQRRPDISMAREKLGWEPSINLDAGLRKTIPYFAKLIGCENSGSGDGMVH